MSKELTAVVMGTNTVCAVIAEYVKEKNSAKKIKVLGIGYQATKGVEYGGVFSLGDLEVSVINAIATASSKAQKNVHSVIVALPPWSINSQIIEISKEIGNTAIDAGVVNAMVSECTVDDEEVLHVIPIDYLLDDTPNIKDPIGMVGNKLTAVFHVLSVRQGLLNNLRKCFNKNNIKVTAFVSAPVMSAFALLQNNDSNALVIDMGGSSNSITCVSSGIMLYSKHVAIGSDSITRDIVKVLKVDEIEAERLKILYGLAGASSNDGTNTLLTSNIDDFGNRNIQTVSYNMLNLIIYSRLDEIFDSIKKHILINNIGEDYYQNILITGGGSRLVGLDEYLRTKTFLVGSSVSIAPPVDVIGKDEYIKTGSFTTAAGTLLYGFEKMGKTILKKNSLFKKIKSWFQGGI